MSQSSKGVPPYRVAYSGRCREATKQLLVRAKAKGCFAAIAQTLQDIDHRLLWIPLDFGEPLKDHVQLGITEYLGVLPPLVVRYGVDEARRIVNVVLPSISFPGANSE